MVVSSKREFRAAPGRPQLRIDLSDKWMDVDLEGEHRVLSWALVGGGMRRARRVSWRYVTDRDLTVGADPVQWTLTAMNRRTVRSEVVLLTARRLAAVEQTMATADGTVARAVATVGLGNAVRIGTPSPFENTSSARPLSPGPPGTINILCHVNRPLSEAAMLEVMSLVAEARTAAVLQRHLPDHGLGFASGTGTDCIAVAAPISDQGESHIYAGKHTLIGRLVGEAVLEAVGRGADRWIEERLSMGLKRRRVL